MITLGTFKGFPFRMPIDRMLISMRVSPDGSAAIGGVISGIVSAETFIKWIVTWRGAFSASCDGASEWGCCLSSQLRQASDVLADGTLDPSRPCDAISIGLGFEASAVRLGPIVDVPPPPDWCAMADGGTD
jgi:hypothetical protein